MNSIFYILKVESDLRVSCSCHGITGKSKGWTHHPAVQQWKGYEVAFKNYSKEK